MSKAEELYGRPWIEPEFVVVLHYYFEYQDRPRHAGSDYIKELSSILGRTESAILMRMENYASIDPAVQRRVGLININALGRRIFNAWNENREALRRCADLLIREAKRKNVPTLFDSSPVRIPKAFDRYELVDELGHGSYGRVFSCIDTRDGKPYAIKIIQSDNIHDPNAFHRFLREIRALRSVDHPNVIKLHEDNLDSERNFPAFVMDLATHSLSAYAEEFSRARDIRVPPVLPLTEAMSIVHGALNAVEALHSNRPRLIHRDVNPNNLLRLQNGSWVLADFGLAKFLSTAPVSTTFRTTTHRGWGTMWFTAPEQYSDFLNSTERTDIYSLGMLIWELFSTSLPPPSERETGLRGRLEAVHLKAIARDPNSRYGDVDELRRDFLKAIEEGTFLNSET